ncbi:unnamed protein product [Amoebophrya sp. A120]|nr:unnamed protein product [Amoebophrya sp. A120]|eukprot:GSA120T00024114001.1
MVRILRAHGKTSEFWHAGKQNWRQTGACVGVDLVRQEALVRPTGSNKVMALRPAQVKKFVFTTQDIGPASVPISEYMAAPFDFRPLPGIIEPRPEDSKEKQTPAAAPQGDDKQQAPRSIPKKIAKEQKPKTKPKTSVLQPRPPAPRQPPAPQQHPAPPLPPVPPPPVLPLVEPGVLHESANVPEPAAGGAPGQTTSQVEREIFGSPIELEETADRPAKQRRLSLANGRAFLVQGRTASYTNIDDRGAAFCTFNLGGTGQAAEAKLTEEAQQFLDQTYSGRVRLVDDESGHAYLEEVSGLPDEPLLLSKESLKEQLLGVGSDVSFLRELIAKRGRQTVFRSAHMDPIITELNTLLNGRPVLPSASGFDGAAYVVECKAFRPGCRVPSALERYDLGFQFGPKCAFQFFDPQVDGADPANHHLFLKLEQPKTVDLRELTPNGSSVELTLVQIERYNLWHLIDSARASEVSGVLRLGVFDLDDQRDERPQEPGTSVVSSRIVFTLKFAEGEFRKAKMRWCAKGFQDSRLQRGTLEKRCHTLADSSFLVILHWLAKRGHYCHLVDISQAFLRGDPLTDPVFLEIPEALRGNPLFNLTGRFVRLRRTLYGLADAPLKWQKSLFASLREAGWVQDISDPCLWFHHKKQTSSEQEGTDEKQQQEEQPAPAAAAEDHDGPDDVRRNNNPLLSTTIDDPLISEEEIDGVLGCHVDDLIYGGSAAAHESLEQVFNKYPPGSRTVLLEDKLDTFCGRTVKCVADESAGAATRVTGEQQWEKKEGGALVARAIADSAIGFEVGQQSFIEAMKLISDEDASKFLSNRKTNKNPLRRAVGELMWTTKTSLCFTASTCIAAGKIDDEAEEDEFLMQVSEVNELIRTIKTFSADMIRIRPTSSSDDLLLGLVDASLVPRLGAMVCLVNKRQPTGQPGDEKLLYNLVGFYSSKPARVFSSSTSAELLAIRLIISELLYFRNVCVAAGLISRHQPLVVLTDSNNIVQSSTNQLIRCPTERNLRADYFYLQRLLNDGDLQLSHIKGMWNPSDIMTKEHEKSNLEMVRRFLQENETGFDLPAEAKSILEP